jgi:hypothetical protein
VGLICWLLGSIQLPPAHSTHAPAKGYSLSGSALATGSHCPSGTTLPPSRWEPWPHEEGGRLSSPPPGRRTREHEVASAQSNGGRLHASGTRGTGPPARGGPVPGTRAILT